MLSAERNRMLTQVGPGTPMGDLLRRYWQPIGGASEFDSKSVKAIRLLGEDLTLYKDLSGTFGLVDRHCTHRRADLSYGFVEQKGLRCNYHGWCFDELGQCIEQPYDDHTNPNERRREKCAVKAYPVKEVAGLLWAYMGPLPAPELPIWEPFTWQNGFREIAISDVPCNWFQCQENSCDPVHFEWMHDNWSIRLKGNTGPYSPTHLQLKFEEFPYGFIYKRIREGGGDQDTNWTTGRVALWPNGFYLSSHFEWRVPVDDENTLSVTWFYMRVPKGREPYVQNTVPTWYAPVVDADGRWITSHVMNQDFVAWVGQGRIADRTKEVLSGGDVGISMIRNRFFSEIDLIKTGADPKGTIRDPQAARCVELPCQQKQVLIDGIELGEYPKYPLLNQRLSGFRHLAGQPPEVRKAFVDAFGLER